jgi:hypothetical protein
MTSLNQVTLVLYGEDASSIDWDRVDRSHGVIAMTNYRVCKAALEIGIRELGKEIVAVIFDRVVGAELFLDFLADLPHEFRGDVLLIGQDGSGYLSSASRGDGRILYTLRESDVDFYLTNRFGEERSAEFVSRELLSAAS